MTDWEKIRNDFPITKNFNYFQSAAMSPPPKPVFKAIQKEYQKLHMQGIFIGPKISKNSEPCVQNWRK